jgi:hypothetical protein
VQALVRKIERAIGTVGARFLRQIVVERSTFAQYAAARGKRGERGVSQVAAQRANAGRSSPRRLSCAGREWSRSWARITTRAGSRCHLVRGTGSASPTQTGEVEQRSSEIEMVHVMRRVQTMYI